MYAELLEQFTEFNKNLPKPFAQYQAFITQTAEKMAKLQINAANEWMNLNINHVQNLSTIQRPEEYLDLHSHYLNKTTSQCMDGFNQLLTTSLQASAEFTELVNDGLKTFTAETTKTKK